MGDAGGWCKRRFDVIVGAGLGKLARGANLKGRFCVAREMRSVTSADALPTGVSRAQRRKNFTAGNTCKRLLQRSAGFGWLGK